MTAGLNFLARCCKLAGVPPENLLVTRKPEVRQKVQKVSPASQETVCCFEPLKSFAAGKNTHKQNLLKKNKMNKSVLVAFYLFIYLVSSSLKKFHFQFLWALFWLLGYQLVKFKHILLMLLFQQHILFLFQRKRMCCRNKIAMFIELQKKKHRPRSHASYFLTEVLLQPSDQNARD